MEIKDIYNWEIQIADGTVIKQYNKDGSGNNWKFLPDGKPLLLNEVVQVSFIPKSPLFPKHVCLIDISKGERFERRFARGFIKPERNGMFEYLHVCVTNRYRMYVFSTTGNVIMTRNDYEIYL